VSRWTIFAAIALGAFSASPARAQFTAAVSPPKRVDTVKVAALRADSSKRADSVLAERMTDMKTWVDSAAAALAAHPAAPESAQVVAQASRDSTSVSSAQGDVAPTPAPAKTTAKGETTGETRAFRNGAPAPATATNLPTFTLLGAATLTLGLLLRRR
jgi:hypothetical protein